MNNEMIKEKLEKILIEKQNKIGFSENSLKIDLHCHDKNSNKPSERLGRILGIPETWLETDDLLKDLESNNTSAITITNHNNARSCWELQDRGLDILSGSEFTCKLPDSKLSIHVLTYGFTPAQEVTLNRIRGNLYYFLSYCLENDILTVWAHPLYFNNNKFHPKIVKDLEHIVTLFTHFEGINGQRDSRQNLITIQWLKTFNEEKIHKISRDYGINITNVCRDSLACNIVGGSDDHMGLLSGTSGTYIHIDNLDERLKTSSRSNLVLEGLKAGNVAPYGFYTEQGKMSITFLELFYMIVKNMEDPGLIRILLHKGTYGEKAAGLLINNGIAELRRHKFTLQFLKSFHNALHGKGPHFWAQTFVKKSAKPMIHEIENIAKSKSKSPEIYVQNTEKSLQKIFTILNRQAFNRSSENIKKLSLNNNSQEIKLQDILEKIEIPATFRSYIEEGEESAGKKDSIDIGRLFDRLPFPILASSIIAGSNFISSKVLNSNREYLDHFSEISGMGRRTKKMLWLTDTFTDKNGIAISLNNYRNEIISKNLPIDFLVCHETLKSDDHLIVTKPVGTFNAPMYKEQAIRIPNIVEIHEIFKSGNYDRIICSTELLMGVAGLYLKSCFNVKTYFFIHTDWLEFSKQTLELSGQVQNRLKRFSRQFYRSFDKLFVLNNDHKKWLTGNEMLISENKIITTKHWVSPIFTKSTNSEITIRRTPDEKIILYVGRLSKEKGLLDFPYIIDRLKEDFINYRAVFVGRGPLKNELEREIPDALFIDWIEQSQLPQIYSQADFFIFPSKFDTFGRVVLESMSCGCPVAAYNEKGPKDIIEHGINGILASNKYDLAEEICQTMESHGLYQRMKIESVKRSQYFSKDTIIDNFLRETDLMEEGNIEEREVINT